MNKIKKVLKENKVLIVLGVILLLCLAIFIGVSVTYFYGSNSDKYGNRLESIKNVPLDEKLFNDIKEDVSKKENVTSVDISLKGRIVYITMAFNESAAVESAKSVAEGVVSLFNDDELAVYDLQFIIKSSGDSKFTLMGSRNSNGSGVVVWNNYNKQEG